ncbi:C4-dicarboxylate ABC transporter permease [Marivita sp. XM-24bin2]|jgi:TRAP-type mannitol/chloroaromatic compound transport system permease small subunit|uniref:TRAP transporter small permease subunit n=1 Tax=unclassified Marivita TaxID=2632480 RepID=UPI000D793916|nr:C4-dicarboxylate ABC transporter permease [Marivita sp. XM-24bin2]MCR9108096.1 C4-dicarboxylate ABC transporter permease [Paracoccaceae bacterium]PWL36029.1 MAG: C4-dicarboxylate ABC transporter permease [Marivita sp. XM-24bin2]
MVDFILWVLQNIVMAPYHLLMAVFNPGAWLNWSEPTSVMRFIYYGASVELFFVVFTTFLILTVLGLVWKRQILWVCVKVMESIANGIGRFAAWAGLLMVLQQVMIVFLQRIFRVAEIEMGPLGTAFAKDLSWWAEELKLYNAMVVALCVTYTFVQGGHVRVDLFYSKMKYGTKRLIDMFGCMFFMLPAVTITYLYAWFFMWRHLMTPAVTANGNLDLMLRQSRVFRWNVETIGFSPNGFNAYFLFKILIVAFCVLTFMHAIAFFWRSLLEYIEGEESDGKYLDRDGFGSEAEEIEHAIHSGST